MNACRGNVSKVVHIQTAGVNTSPLSNGVIMREVAKHYGSKKKAV
jgi:hypothetical protein